MAKWFHPEVNGVVDVFPKDASDEQTLRRQGLYPADEVIESDESYEASTAILEQAQAVEEKRRPGRPRKQQGA